MATCKSRGHKNLAHISGRESEDDDEEEEEKEEEEVVKCLLALSLSRSPKSPSSGQ